jgi:hypothetical protein
MKVSNKLAKVDGYFQVNMYDNGYMIEVSGRNDEDDYETARIMTGDVDGIIDLVKDITSMERDS